eukprot:scaffold523_cov101-Cylindrotheca_fusiformis.AAC.7
MSEVINLADSSDDDKPQQTISACRVSDVSSSRNANNSPAVICLLDDEENDKNGVSIQKHLKSQNNKHRILCNNSNDDSDSEDSLEFFCASGLTHKSTKEVSKKEETPHPHPSTTTAAMPTPSATKPPPPESGCVTILNPYTPASLRRPTCLDRTTSSSGAKRTPPLLPVMNPYASSKKKRPRHDEETVDASQFPTNLTPRAKSYPDLRAKMTLCLWKYSRTLTRQSHNRGRLDQMAKKIVALSLAEHPIRSLEEYLVRFQQGSKGTNINAVSTFRNRLDELREQLELGGWSRASTAIDSCNGKYYTVAEACLVACLRWVVTQQQEDVTNGTNGPETAEQHLQKKEQWISVSWLLPEIDRRLHTNCPATMARSSDADQGVDFYTRSSTISAEYKQIEKLCSLLYLKARRSGGKVVFEMTPLGYKTAQRLQSRIYPAPLGPYRCSNQVDRSEYSNIVMGMDLREGGGGSKVVLHQMCNKLDWTKLPYFVSSLAIGDYIFMNQGKLVPVLIERKSVQDVAQSIYDGRWQSQKRRMYHGQYVFGYGQSRLAFIIEGKQERHQVTGGFIGNAAFQVTIEQLNDEIEKLKSEGFDVLRTSSHEHSMFELARWAKQIARQVDAGHLEAKYSYHEFKSLVAKIPSTTDLSRLAKDHYKNRQDRETAIRTISIDDDGGGGGSSSAGSDDVDLPKPQRLMYTTANVRAKQNRRLSIGKPCNTTKVVDHDYSKWTRSQLEQECLRHGLSKSGTRDKMVERLQQPRPPLLWIQRKQKGEWVPARHDVAGTALLVALWLLHQADPSSEDFSRNEVYIRAEALCITKNPFSGGTTQTGP